MKECIIIIKKIGTSLLSESQEVQKKHLQKMGRYIQEKINAWYLKGA